MIWTPISCSITHIVETDIGQPWERGSSDFWSNGLRFDNKATRDERKKINKLAAISEIWNMLLENCKQSYEPGSNFAIDEQLVGFRGHCPFRMYSTSHQSQTYMTLK